MAFENDIKEIAKKIYRGNAVLFVGAGFSADARGFNDDLPTREELKQKIDSLMNTLSDNNASLSDTADYFIEAYCKQNKNKLDEFIDWMKDTFSVKSTKEHHQIIAALPWRRIYTTNYDNVIEEAAKVKNIRIESKTLDDKVEDKNLCLHINGKICDLNKETLESKFKLSSSSYVSYETFYNTDWKTLFQNDIEIASSVVFIGYSLYDIDIEKILAQNNDRIKNKVIFIQKENTSHMKETQYHKLSKYGKVYSIGTEKFTKILQQNKPNDTDKEEFYLECLEEYTININETKIREADIENFLIFGKIEPNFLQKETIKQLNKPPFLIHRKQIDLALYQIKTNGFLVVLGDIGNGKTVFLQQLATKLAESERVFILNTANNLSAKRDIDKISKLNENSIIIIDSYTNYLEVLDYIHCKNSNKIKLVIAARMYEHYRQLGNSNKDYINRLDSSKIEMDTLNEDEILAFYKIIDHTALWKKYAGKPDSVKYKIMKEKCRSEISLILMDILESEQMDHKIKETLDKVLLKNEEIKKQFFVICLLGAMDIPITTTLLEDIINKHDLQIYKNENIQNFMELHLVDRNISIKSSIFAFFILKKYFSKDITSLFVSILKLIHKKSYSNDNIIAYNLTEVKRNLLRFNFIERLLPEEGKINTLTMYYENLKTEFPHLLQDPQYWLQYAMCFIMANNLSKAQEKLTTAYEKINQRNHYDKSKIDNQQARLWLKKAAQHNTNIKEAIELFLKADKLLNQQNSDVYKYKIMLEYKNFIDNRSSSFNQEQRNQVVHCCEKQLKILENLTKERYKETQTYEKCKRMLEEKVSIFKHKK